MGDFLTMRLIILTSLVMVVFASYIKTSSYKSWGPSNYMSSYTTLKPTKPAYQKTYSTAAYQPVTAKPSYKTPYYKPRYKPVRPYYKTTTRRYTTV